MDAEHEFSTSQCLWSILSNQEGLLRDVEIFRWCHWWLLTTTKDQRNAIKNELACWKKCFSQQKHSKWWSSLESHIGNARKQSPAFPETLDVSITGIQQSTLLRRLFFTSANTLWDLVHIQHIFTHISCMTKYFLSENISILKTHSKCIGC